MANLFVVFITDTSVLFMLHEYFMNIKYKDIKIDCVPKFHEEFLH